MHETYHRYRYNYYYYYYIYIYGTYLCIAVCRCALRTYIASISFEQIKGLYKR